jgi:pSer/pThr/pTyr-binding forkhead associated (FHA) protein
MVRLIIKYNDRHLKTYELDDPVITVGRLPENTISVANMGFSRRHFRIERDPGGQYVLSDLNSLNGTYVNNKRVKSVTLGNGDIISIGKHSVVFEMGTAGAAVAAPAAAPAGAAAAVPPVTTETKRHPAEAEGGEAVAGSDTAATRSGEPADSSSFCPVLIETNKHVVYKLDKDVISLGSSENDDIFVTGFMIGDEHVVIERTPTGASIRANKLMGKFKVNGQKAKVHNLAHKDRIEIGNSTFRYMENE